jgi:hypothetical protein
MRSGSHGARATSGCRIGEAKDSREQLAAGSWQQTQVKPSEELRRGGERGQERLGEVGSLAER